MVYKKFLSKLADCKLLNNNKGLTFKGALAIVLILHLVGAGIFCGYIKYQSYRYQLAKQEYEDGLQQATFNKVDWNHNNLKLKVVAVPRPKPVAKITNRNQSVYKSSTEFALNVLNKTQQTINTTAVFVNQQVISFIKKIQTTQPLIAQNKSKQSQSTISTKNQQKNTAWKLAADNYQPKRPQVKKTELSEAEKRLAKALEYDKKKAKTETITITVPPSVSRSIPPIKITNPVNTRSINNDCLTEKRIINSNGVNSPLRYTSEVDQQTSEVVHTFYSY